MDITLQYQGTNYRLWSYTWTCGANIDVHMSLDVGETLIYSAIGQPPRQMNHLALIETEDGHTRTFHLEGYPSHIKTDGLGFVCRFELTGQSIEILRASKSVQT